MNKIRYCQYCNSPLEPNACKCDYCGSLVQPEDFAEEHPDNKHEDSGEHSDNKRKESGKHPDQGVETNQNKDPRQRPGDVSHIGKVAQEEKPDSGLNRAQDQSQKNSENRTVAGGSQSGYSGMGNPAPTGANRPGYNEAGRQNLNGTPYQGPYIGGGNAQQEKKHFTPLQIFLMVIAVLLLAVAIVLGFFVLRMRDGAFGFSAQRDGDTVVIITEQQSDDGADIKIHGENTEQRDAAEQIPSAETQPAAETEAQKQESDAALLVQDITLTYEEFKLTLPASWSGKYGVLQKAGDGTEVWIFYQKASYEQNGCGILFTIDKYTDLSYTQLPNYDVIGTGDGTAFVWTLPTDVQFTVDAHDEYSAMEADLETIRSSVVLLVSGDGPQETEAEGYLPDSSDRVLTEADVAGMGCDDIQMAINEIYARHGRKFATASIQEYFDRQSWYNGTVEPDDFDDAVFSAIERQNIQFLVEKMNSLS